LSATTGLPIGGGMLANLWNFVQFQAGWFALVLTAAAGYPVVGVLMMAILAGVHVACFARPNEWVLLALISIFGWLWESVVHTSGLIGFAGHSPDAPMAPLWMAMLWLNFATVLNHSLAWLKGRYWLAMLLAGGGGPMAFWGGEMLGAASLPRPGFALGVIGLAWGLFLPLMLTLAQKLCPLAEPPVRGDSRCASLC
jgi:Protein of unknown function (DUF2878)